MSRQSSRSKWRENPNGIEPNLVGEDDRGDFWVCPRKNRREFPALFNRRFKRSDPRCWGAWLRSWWRGECTFLDPEYEVPS